MRALVVVLTLALATCAPAAETKAPTPDAAEPAFAWNHTGLAAGVRIGGLAEVSAAAVTTALVNGLGFSANQITAAAKMMGATTASTWHQTAVSVVGIGGIAKVSAPAVTTAFVHGLGFAEGGITAGSAAAKMMGATTAVGSHVAAMQSIGATGSLAYLGTAGTAATVAGIAVVFGGVAVGGYAAYHAFRGMEAEDSNRNMCMHNVTFSAATCKPLPKKCRQARAHRSP